MALRLGLMVTLTMVLLGAMCGCGSPKLVPVEGIVHLDGKPLAEATVVFLPDGAPGRPAQGFTSVDGRFHLATVSDQGAEPGNYKVTISKTVGILPPGAEPAAPDDERKMRKQREDFDKHSDKYLRSLIPTIYGSPTTTPLRCKVPADQPLVLDLTSSASLPSTSRNGR